MTYVMSDLHGMYDKYISMLEKINFSDDDRMFIIGDVADRGEYPVRILLDMMERPNIWPLMGNHDLCALRMLDRLLVEVTEENSESWLNMNDMNLFLEWMQNGGMKTVNDIKRYPVETRKAVMEYIEEFSMYEVIDIGDLTYIMVHAGLGNFRKDKKLSEYTSEELLFHRTEPDDEYFDDKSVFVITGHTPVMKFQTEPKIIKRKNNIMIDCGAVFGGKLACLCLETLEEYYV